MSFARTTHRSFPARLRRRPAAHRPRIIPATVFEPQDSTLSPEEHFPLQTNLAIRAHPRFINRFDSREILLVVDGSCVNNGRHCEPSTAPIGGCSFTFRNSESAPIEADSAIAGLSLERGIIGTGTIGFQLERLGPTGQEWEHTSNCAKLRAVIAALQFREGGRKVGVES